MTKSICSIVRSSVFSLFVLIGVFAADAAKAESTLTGYWHCDLMRGLDESHNIRLKQTGGTLTGLGYNKGVLTDVSTLSGTIEGSQLTLLESYKGLITKRYWTASFDGQKITGTYQMSFNGGVGTLSCFLAPEEDLGTTWRCSGPTILKKGKAVTRKAANSQLQSQINALGNSKKDKIKRKILKAIKKAINGCGGG